MSHSHCGLLRGSWNTAHFAAMWPTDVTKSIHKRGRPATAAVLVKSLSIIWNKECSPMWPHLNNWFWFVMLGSSSWVNSNARVYLYLCQSWIRRIHVASLVIAMHNICLPALSIPGSLSADDLKLGNQENSFIISWAMFALPTWDKAVEKCSVQTFLGPEFYAHWWQSLKTVQRSLMFKCSP